MRKKKTGSFTYKVWIQIEEYNEETGESEELDAPGAAIQSFETYDEAFAYSSALTTLAGDQLEWDQPKKKAEPAFDKAALALQVFKVVFDHYESFREDNVGADLAYLMGAILDDEPDSIVDWSSDWMEKPPVFLELLRKCFNRESPLWQFIKLEADV